MVTLKIRENNWTFGLAIGLALGCVILFCHSALAQAPPTTNPAPMKPSNREMGEEETIRARIDWFYTPRRVGATRKMSELRWQAVGVTKEKIREQQDRISRGESRGLEVWTGRGPSPANYGTWTFGQVSGRIVALAKDWTNNILYVGAASGGVWKSYDNGTSWTNTFDNVGSCAVGSIAIDPNNHDILYAGTGENSMYCEIYFGIGLLRSTDGGNSWHLRNGTGGVDLGDLADFASIIVDPRDSSHLIVGCKLRDCSSGFLIEGGLFTSDDAGLTWTQRLAACITEIVQDPVDQDIFWAGTANKGVYKSTDNGQNWIQQTASGLPTGNVTRTEVTVSPVNHNVVYVLFGGAGDPAVPYFYRTDNGGTSWQLMSSGTDACDGQCDYNMAIRAHLTEVNTVFRGTICLFKSTDGGATWTNLVGVWNSNQLVHQDMHYLLMHPTNPDVFFIGCDGGIWRTEDGGTSFTNHNGNLCITQFYAIGTHPTDDNIIVGGSQDNASLVRHSGDVWDLQAETGDGFISLINPVDTNWVYVASYANDFGSGKVPNVLRSTTGLFGPFTTITDVANGITPGERINWVTPYTFTPTNPARMFVGTHRVYRSLDRGSSWTPVGPADMTNGGKLVTIETHQSNGSYVYAGSTDGKVWKSSDQGDNWTDISSGLPVRQINDIALDPQSNARVYCVTSGFGTAHVWGYSGSGNWEPLGNGLPDVPTNTIFCHSSQRIFVGNDVGIFRSLDGGTTFEPFMNGLPLGVPFMDIKYNVNTMTLTAGSYGRGVWQLTLQPLECCPCDTF